MLVLVLMLGGVLKKKMGVDVLRGKKCESQAPNFSFAFAKGRRGRYRKRTEERSVETRHGAPVCPPTRIQWP